MNNADQVKCPICGSMTATLWQDFQGAYSFTGNKYNFLRTKKWSCAHCKHIFATDQPPLEDLKDFYTAQDRSNHTITSVEIIKKQGYYKDALRMIEKIISKRNKHNKQVAVLDIGCGSGELLISIKEKYPAVITQGIDINPVAREAERVSSVEIKTGFFPEIKFNTQKYDLIILNGVLEHQEMPGDFIKIVSEFLKDDGELFITVPDAVSILTERSDIGYKRIHDIMNDEHLHHFTFHSLITLLKNSGILINDYQFISKGIWDEIQVRGIRQAKQVALKMNSFAQNISISKAHEVYQESKACIRVKMKEIFNKFKKIGIYGAGWHTMVILPLIFPEITQYDFNIYDIDRRKTGLKLFNRKVIHSSSETIGIPHYYLLSTIDNLNKFREYLINHPMVGDDKEFISLYSG